MLRRSVWLDAALFTAAVYAATVAIQVYQPATGGYFNLGEAVIYVAAVLSAPIAAGLAGGVGAALADATTGYAIFAPGTLVIKFAEGFIAGHLVRKFAGLPRRVATGATYAAATAYGCFVSFVGSRYLSGEASVGTAWAASTVDIPGVLWGVLGAAVVAVVALMGYRGYLGPEAAAFLLAGLVMVSGYFAYEYAFSNPITGRPPEAAVAEVPINVGQAVIGASAASSLVGFLRKAGYVGSIPR